MCHLFDRNMLSTNNSIHILKGKISSFLSGQFIATYNLYEELLTICKKNRSRGFRIVLTLMWVARHAGPSAARPMAAFAAAATGAPLTGKADRIRHLSLLCRQLEMTPVVWCRNPIVLPGRISLPATRRGRANLPIRVYLRRRYLNEKTLALCRRLRR